MNISCLEELQMKLDLCLSRDEKLSILENVGKKIKTDKWFVVTDDGQCYLFDNNGMLDDISKVTEICDQHIRLDIKRIHIPDGVKSIRNWAFSYCTSTTTTTISNGVTSIGAYAFKGCCGLTSITFKGKTLEQVKAMNCYPFEVINTSIIHVE